MNLTCWTFKKCFIIAEIGIKLRSSRTESNWPLRATCAKTAAPTWYAEAILTLLLFWPMVARSCQLDSALDERSLLFLYNELPKGIKLEATYN